MRDRASDLRTDLSCLEEHDERKKIRTEKALSPQQLSFSGEGRSSERGVNLDERS